jgi:hypothetical protein
MPGLRHCRSDLFQQIGWSFSVSAHRANAWSMSSCVREVETEFSEVLDFVGREP